MKVAMEGRLELPIRAPWDGGSVNLCFEVTLDLHILYESYFSNVSIISNIEILFTLNQIIRTNEMRSASVRSGGGSVVPSVRSTDVGSNSRTLS